MREVLTAAVEVAFDRDRDVGEAAVARKQRFVPPTDLLGGYADVGITVTRSRR